MKILVTSICPEGEESWCEWQKRTVLGMDPGNHPGPLHPEVQKEILPIYVDLSRDELLERCLGGHTQNAKESFNSTIWRLTPKHLHCDLKVVEVAAYLATGLFNEGNSSLLMVMNEAEIIVGNQSFNYAQQMDEQRVKRQNRRNSMETKEAWVARKAALQAKTETFEEKGGLLYGAGIAD